MSIKRKPSTIERKMIISPLKAYLTRKFRIEIIRNDTIDLKPPYIILSNHTNNWDPLIINCFVEEPICFVAAAPLFRHPLLKKVLDYTGAIPKTKARLDTSTIRNMLAAKKHNRVIGIFPEGNRCWDGQTESIVQSTAKLVKLLNIPVVIGTIQGGYLTHPRWADSDRTGKISLSLEKKWDVDEFKDADIETIHNKLTEALSFDELAWQQEQGIAYKGERLANYLERLLYVCPSCNTIGSLHSEDDLFRCRSCDYSVRYNEYGSFEPKNKPLFYRYVHEWNDWQLQYTKKKLFAASHETAWRDVLKTEVKLFVSEHERPLMLLSTGNLTWHKDHILFTPSNNSDPIRFSIDKLDGVNVHMNSKLDFHYDERMIRMDFFHPRTSAYMWYQILKLSSVQKEG
ncbi:lysophospholipid acyltransferase family protein [Paenibacillus sp. FSL W7-1287]|uniref:lysophospholipid acyltransferase family protein n=1 Tax=Paenibacillus sp. FSL W7-1287 TaxID=2954538 RepID=UPI0030F63227